MLTRKRLGLYTGALLFLYLVLAGRFFHEAFFDGPRVCDFAQYWAAGRLALHGKAAAVYDRNELHAEETACFGRDFPNLHYNYPPVFLMLHAPLSILPYPLALSIFTLTGVALFVLVASRICADELTPMVSLAFPAVILNVSYGQNGLYSAALLGAGTLLIDSMPAAAGILFGFLVYKPNLALVAPVAMLVSKRYRALAAFTVTALTLVVLSACLFGTQAWVSFSGTLSAVFDFTRTHPEILYRHSTLFGALRLAGLPMRTSLASQSVLSLLSLAALVWVFTGKDGASWKAYARAAIVCCALLATPYAMEYDLALAGMAIAWYCRDKLDSAEAFDPAERSILVAAWLVPFLGRHVARATGVVIAPAVIAALFILVLRRHLRVRSPTAIGRV